MNPLEQGVKLVLPDFVPGRLVCEASQYRVIMGWKPGEEGEKRFFIQPLTDEAEAMLHAAALMHRIPNFNTMPVKTEDGIRKRECLRANFEEDNLPVLLLGEMQIPSEGEDTVPSLERMEECLRLHPNFYTFSDEAPQS